jgi:hypothetical protein
VLTGAVIGGRLVGSEREFDVHPLVLPHVHPTLDALHRIETRAIGPIPELELELAPRVNLLLGDNGLGKTFVLDVAWWAATGTWPGRPAWPDPEHRSQSPRIRLVESDGQVSESRFDARLETWPRGEGWPRTSAAILYARIDGGVSIWDPLHNDLHGLGHPDSLPAYHLSARELEHGLVRGEVSLCNGLIADWERWKHDDPKLFARVFAVLRGLFVPGEAPHPGPSVQLGKHDQTVCPRWSSPTVACRSCTSRPACVQPISCGTRRPWVVSLRGQDRAHVVQYRLSWVVSTSPTRSRGIDP